LTNKRIPPGGKLFYTAYEAGDELEVSHYQIKIYIRTGDLKAFAKRSQSGQIQWMIRRDHLLEFMRRKEKSNIDFKRLSRMAKKNPGFVIRKALVEIEPWVLDTLHLLRMEGKIDRIYMAIHYELNEMATNNYRGHQRKVKVGKRKLSFHIEKEHYEATQGKHRKRSRVIRYAIRKILDKHHSPKEQAMYGSVNFRMMVKARLIKRRVGTWRTRENIIQQHN